jgi:cytochrome c peroxidase
MATSVDEVLAKLNADPKVANQFEAAYGRVPDRASLLDAIATFERSLLTPGSRFDRWLDGDTGALTDEELLGYRLFKSLGCISCHQGVNVGGNLYQRHGILIHSVHRIPKSCAYQVYGTWRRRHRISMTVALQRLMTRYERWRSHSST